MGGGRDIKVQLLCSLIFLYRPEILFRERKNIHSEVETVDNSTLANQRDGAKSLFQEAEVQVNLKTESEFLPARKYFQTMFFNFYCDRNIHHHENQSFPN